MFIFYQMSYVMKNKEIWKDVVGYEGLYEVSSEGRVRNCNRFVTIEKNGKIIQEKMIFNLTKKENGYLCVDLVKIDKKTKKKMLKSSSSNKLQNNYKYKSKANTKSKNNSKVLKVRLSGGALNITELIRLINILSIEIRKTYEEWGYIC